MSSKAWWIGLVLALAACLTGCKTSGSEGQWVSAKVSAGHERLLLEVTELALRKSGFPVGAGLDPAHLMATSGWKNSLAPFKGKGYREQATVKFEREQDRKYRVDVRVKRETNEDIARPMDLSYAQWESAADNAELARIVLRFIQGLLSTGEEVLAKPGQAP
jgi:hypothetical protein